MGTIKYAWSSFPLTFRSMSAIALHILNRRPPRPLAVGLDIRANYSSKRNLGQSASEQSLIYILSQAT